VCVLAGAWYALAGLLSHHFRQDLLPGRQEKGPPTYGFLQRTAYSAVVFVLFPLVILSGLAMSPAITSVLPALVIVFGGQQSARTIHFFLAASIVLFFAGHVTMVGLAGFTKTLRGMITGRPAAREGRP
jgi:thiosulfate reductase cytochrome b subunit